MGRDSQSDRMITLGTGEDNEGGLGNHTMSEPVKCNKGNAGRKTLATECFRGDRMFTWCTR